MDSFCRYRSCSCSREGSFMWHFRHSCLGRRNLILARLVPSLQLLRDKMFFRGTKEPMLRSCALTITLILCALPVRAGTIPAPTLDTRVIISVRDQKLI